MTASEDVVPLIVTVGPTADGSLILRFPPEYSDELLALLDEHQLDHGTILEFSAGADEWIEAVKVLGPTSGGLVALGIVIRTFVLRHAGKKFRLKRDGVEIDADGFSMQQVQQILKDTAMQQAVIDERWRKMTEQMNGDSDDV
jgi:hypothetical protein